MQHTNQAQVLNHIRYSNHQKNKTFIETTGEVIHIFTYFSRPILRKMLGPRPINRERYCKLNEEQYLKQHTLIDTIIKNHLKFYGRLERMEELR